MCGRHAVPKRHWRQRGPRMVGGSGQQAEWTLPQASLLPLPPLEATWHRICDSLSNAT